MAGRDKHDPRHHQRGTDLHNVGSADFDPGRIVHSYPSEEVINDAPATPHTCELPQHSETATAAPGPFHISYHGWQVEGFAIALVSYCGAWLLLKSGYIPSRESACTIRTTGVITFTDGVRWGLCRTKSNRDRSLCPGSGFRGFSPTGARRRVRCACSPIPNAPTRLNHPTRDEMHGIPSARAWYADRAGGRSRSYLLFR